MLVATIESQLVEFLRGATGQVALNADTELLDTGIADSLTIMDLIVYVETELKVRLEAGDLTAETFRTPAALAALVAARLGLARQVDAA